MRSRSTRDSYASRSSPSIRATKFVQCDALRHMSSWAVPSAPYSFRAPSTAASPVAFVYVFASRGASKTLRTWRPTMFLFACSMLTTRSTGVRRWMCRCAYFHAPAGWFITKPDLK